MPKDHSGVATAVGFYLLGTLQGSRARQGNARRLLQTQAGRLPTRLGIAVPDLERQLRAAAHQIQALYPGKITGGDVELQHVPADVAIYRAGLPDLHIEIKAQTLKPDIGAFVQADWIGDTPDYLRWRHTTDATFRAQVRRAGFSARFAAARATVRALPAWDEGSYWVADIAYLTSSAAKAAVGVRHPSDLAGYVQRKCLVAISQEGTRVVPYHEILPVARYLAGVMHPVSELSVSPPSISHIRLRSDGGAPLRGASEFTYHFGYATSSVPGKHKLHGRSLPNVPLLV